VVTELIILTKSGRWTSNFLGEAEKDGEQIKDEPSNVARDRREKETSAGLKAKGMVVDAERKKRSGKTSLLARKKKGKYHRIQQW